MSKSIATDIFGDPVRSSINSKEKGDKNERYVAQMLSKWTGYSFHRVPGSGGLNWGRDTRVSGDVVAEEGADFPWSVETKHLKGVRYPTKRLRANSMLYKVWEQCTRDASNVGKLPMALVRGNGWIKDCYLCCVDAKVYEVLVVSGLKLLSTGKGLYVFDSRDVMALDYKEILSKLK
jgi:hypothetical protein